MKLQIPQAVFLTGLVAYLAIRVVYQRRAAGQEATVVRSTSADRLLILLVITGQFIIPLMYLVSTLLDFANYHASRALVGVGAMVWVAGLQLFWRSHADLGKNWAISLELHKEHRLITNGVYRAVRHPMYSSFLLFGAAQVLLLPNWIAGPSALVAVALLCLLRIPREEAMMIDHFGHEYREYAQRTGRISPRLAATK